MTSTLRRARVAISAVFLVLGVGIGVWIPHIPVMRARLELSDRALGGALLASAVGSVVAMPVVSRLITRFGSRAPTTIFGLAFCVALSLPTGATLAGGVLGFAARLFVFGVTSGAFDVSMNVHASRVETELGRPIMSSVHGLFSLGMLLGSAAASFSLARGNLPAFAALLASMLLAPVLAMAWLGLIPGREGRNDSRPFRIPPKALVILGLVATLGMMSEGGVADWTGVFLTTEVGMPVATAAIAWTGLALASTITRLFVGDRLVERWGGRRVLVGSAVLGASGVAFAAATAHPWLSPIGLGVAWLGLTSFVPIVFSAAGKQPGIAPETSLSAVATLGYVGMLTGPPVIGAISSAVGLRLALLAITAACVAVAWLGRGRAVHLP